MYGTKLTKSPASHTRGENACSDDAMPGSTVTAGRRELARRIARAGRIATTGAALTAAAVILAGCSRTGTSSESQDPSLESPEQIAVLDAPRMPTEPSGVEPTPQPTIPTLDPEQAKTAWKEGVALFQANRYLEASEQLRAVAQSRRSDAYAHYLLGLALWKSGQNDQAQEALERSAGLDPRSARTWINLARVRMDLNDPDGALEASDSAVAIDPSNAQGFHQRGRALAALGRMDESIESLEQGLEADRGNGYIANTLGYVLVREGRNEEALPLLESAKDALPGVAYVRSNLALAYERTGQPGKAAEERRVAGEIRSSKTDIAPSVVTIETPDGGDGVIRTDSAGTSTVPQPTGVSSAQGSGTSVGAGGTSSSTAPLAQARGGDGSSDESPRQH